jgi:hypothetical protein
MKKPIAFLAVVGFVLAADIASAEEPWRDAQAKLSSRIDQNDERLLDSISKRIYADKLETVRREEVVELVARAFEYYKRGDFYTASSMFGIGVTAGLTMDWPADETLARAAYYRAMSEKKFCQNEAHLCLALYSGPMFRGGKYPEIYSAEQVLSKFDLTLLYGSKLPPDLRAVAEKECAAAHANYRKAVAAKPAYLTSHRNVKPPEHYKCRKY